MAQHVAHKPRPVVFAFTLGKHAKAGRKRVPETYATVPCYLHRDAEGTRTKHLDALDEEPVAAADADVIFAAIEVMVERCDLHRELSTDREIDAGKSPAYTTGVHPGVSFDQACDALARGGFTVIRVIDPLAEPHVSLSRNELQARALVDLARHVDHTTLAEVLVATEKDEELGFHATTAEDLVTRAFDDGDSGGFAKGLRALAPSLEPEARDVLAVVLGRTARAARSPKIADAIRAVLVALPAPSDAAVKRLLDAWSRGP